MQLTPGGGVASMAVAWFIHWPVRPAHGLYESFTVGDASWFK